MKLSEQFIRFLFVGGSATILHYAILIALVQSGFAGPVVASSIGFAISALFNYALNRQFTFRSANPHSRAFPRFVTVALTGLAINATLLWIFVKTGLLHYLVAQMLATVGTLLWNFFINKFWTFSPISETDQTNRDAAQ